VLESECSTVLGAIQSLSHGQSSIVLVRLPLHGATAHGLPSGPERPPACPTSSLSKTALSAQRLPQGCPLCKPMGNFHWFCPLVQTLGVITFALMFGLYASAMCIHRCACKTMAWQGAKRCHLSQDTLRSRRGCKAAACSCAFSSWKVELTVAHRYSHSLDVPAEAECCSSTSLERAINPRCLCILR